MATKVAKEKVEEQLTKALEKRKMQMKAIRQMTSSDAPTPYKGVVENIDPGEDEEDCAFLGPKRKIAGDDDSASPVKKLKGSPFKEIV